MNSTPDSSSSTALSPSLVGLTTTLFDFVAVRGVQKTSVAVRRLVAVTAPSNFTPHSALLPSAAESAGAMPPPRRARSGAPPAVGFEATTSYRADLRGVLDHYDDFLEMGGQLRRLRTRSDASALAGHFAKLKLLKGAQASLLWNNLIYQALRGSDARVYDDLACVALANYTVDIGRAHV